MTFRPVVTVIPTADQVITKQSWFLCLNFVKYSFGKVGFTLCIVGQSGTDQGVLQKHQLGVNDRNFGRFTMLNQLRRFSNLSIGSLIQEFRHRRSIRVKAQPQTTPYAVNLLQLEPRVLCSATPLDVSGLDPTSLDSADSPDITLPESEGAGELSSFDRWATDLSSRGEKLTERDPLEELDNLLVNSDASFTSPSESSTQDIVFINSDIHDLQQLLDDLNGINDEVHVVILDSESSGISQISEALSEKSQIGAIHFYSHGTEGQLLLGNDLLNTSTVADFANEMTQWRSSLSEKVDLLFYGCDLAGSASGVELLKTIARITEADVAASNDLTGHSSFGGDWDLEYSLGKIETDIAVSRDFQQNWKGLFAAITVDTFNDFVDGGDTSSIADLIATPGSDGISLREAIEATNNDGGADDIFLSSGTYLLSALGELDIDDDLTIHGIDARSTIIDGGGFDRVIRTRSSAVVSISGVTIQGGLANDNGAGIFVDGSSTLNLTDSQLRFNNGFGGRGGAMHVDGSAFLNRVLITNNIAQTGGGIYFHDSDAGSLTNVTISGNTAFNEGGGLWTDSPITVTNSTIAANAAPNGGGIFDDNGGDVTLKNSILHNVGWDNSNTTLASAGNNIDSDGTAGLGDLLDGIDPMIGSLANNGGQTDTHALLVGSPAINAGSATGAPTADQRGAAHIGLPDIGSYEFGGVLPPTATDNANSIAEDALIPVSGNVLTDDDGFGVDSDPTNDPLTVTQVNLETDPLVDVIGLYGTLDWNSDGSYSYTIDNGNATVQALAVGETLSDVFTYTIDDGTGGTDSATLTITITGTNDDPVATNNLKIITEDTALPVNGNVITDDDGFGVDGDVDTSDVLSVSQIDGETDPNVDLAGLYGTLDWESDGSFSYFLDMSNPTVQTMLPGDSLVETFTYDLFDGLTSDSASLSIQIDGVNDNPVLVRNTSLSVSQGSVATITNSLLEVRDYDHAETDLTFSVSGLTNGQIELTSSPFIPIASFTQAQLDSGLVVYRHNGTPTASDSFTFTVNDATTGVYGPDTFKIDIIDQIVAMPDVASTTESAPLLILAPGMLINDSNVHSDITPGVSLNYDAQGDISPANNIWEDTTGATGFDWDFSGATVTHTLTPNNPPMNLDAAYIFDGSGGGLTDAFHLLPGNPGNKDATFEFWINPSATPGNEVIFETGDADTGTSFTLNGTTLEFNVDDFSGSPIRLSFDLESIGLISGDQYIQVAGVIDRVTGGDSDVYLYVNGSLVDSDVGSNNNVVRWDSGMRAALGHADGLINSTNTGNYQGEIGVFRFYENDLTAAEIQANYDAMVTTGLTVSSINTLGTVGTVGFMADGSYTYDPNGNFEWLAVGETTSDSFTYTVTDGTNTAASTVTITITGENDSPIATANSNTIAEDASIAVSGNVISNDDGFGVDSDPDNSDVLTISQINAENDPLNDVIGSYGTLDWEANGGYSYSVDNANAAVQALAVGETLTDTFTYALDDGNNGTDTATLTITIVGTNDDPTDITISNNSIDEFIDTTGGVSIGSLATVDLDASDTFTYTIVGGTDMANFTIGGAGNDELIFDDGILDYETKNTYLVDIQTQDPSGVTYVETITVSVNDLNDPPIANDDSATGSVGNSVVIDLAVNDTDVDSSLDLTSISIVSGPSNGTVTVHPDGTVTYTHDGSAILTDSFTYTIMDSGGEVSKAATVSITLNAPAPPSPSPPVVVPDPPKIDPVIIDPVVPITGTAAIPEPEPEPTISYEPASLEIEMIERRGVGEPTDEVLFVGTGISFGAYRNDIKQTRFIEMINESGAFEQFYEYKSILWNDLDDLGHKIQKEINLPSITVGSYTAVVTSLSVGYIVWLVRGGQLLVSMMAHLPAWRMLDPMPIFAGTETTEEDEDDSIESIVDNQDDVNDKFEEMSL